MRYWFYVFYYYFGLSDCVQCSHSFLHIVHFINWLSWNNNLIWVDFTDSNYSSHFLLFFDAFAFLNFLKKLIDCVWVDGSFVDIVQCSVHFTCLNIHVFEDFFELFNVFSHAHLFHHLHWFLNSRDTICHSGRHCLSTVCTFYFLTKCSHFSSKPHCISRFFSLSYCTFSMNFGDFHITGIQCRLDFFLWCFGLSLSFLPLFGHLFSLHFKLDGHV